MGNNRRKLSWAGKVRIAQCGRGAMFFDDYGRRLATHDTLASLAERHVRAMKHIEKQQAEIKRLREYLRLNGIRTNELKRSLDIYENKARGNCWFWQGDKTDDLDSMTCPVLITAEDLREIVNEAERLTRQVDAQAAKIKRLREIVDNVGGAVIEFRAAERRLCDLPELPRLQVGGANTERHRIQMEEVDANRAMRDAERSVLNAAGLAAEAVQSAIGNRQSAIERPTP